MPLAPADPAQLVRSGQKDEHYRSFLRNNANEAFQTLAGSKRWLDWRRELELLSDLAYFGLTTLSGYQTLGEEYVNIIQVGPTKRQIPSRARRSLLVLCHCFLPYLLDKVLVCLENQLECGQEGSGGGGGGVRQRQAASGPLSLESWLRRWMQRAVGLLSEPQRRACLPVVFVLRQGVTLLHRLHVALFYISGSFYHLSKRAAAVSYLRVLGPNSNDDSIRSSYRLLGVVSLLQLLITVSLQLNNFRQKQRARQEWKLYRNLRAHSHCASVPCPSTFHPYSLVPLTRLSATVPRLGAARLPSTARGTVPQRAHTPGPRAASCILCLEERRHTTCTPCGHLFCWECITEWSNTKAECPLCREKFQPHRLVYLRNYSA